MKFLKLKDLIISDQKISFVLLDLKDAKTLSEYLNVFEECFGKRVNIDENVFDWLNNGSPLYNNLNFAFLSNSNKLIAAYGLQPGDAFVNGSIRKYGLCTNVMTHPDYTGKGLFVEIGKEALNYVKEIGIEFCFGVPNENALKGHLKVGWNIINEIQFFERKFSESEPLTLIQKEIISNYLPEITDPIYTTLNSKYDFYFLRTAAWEKWRYSKPHSTYLNFGINSDEQKGFMVLKEYNDSKNGIKKLHIVDFGYNDTECFKKMIQHCFYIAKTNKSDVLNLWNYEFNENEMVILNSLGFVPAEKNQIIIHSLDKQIQLPVDNWHVTLYDNDVY